MKAKEVFDEMIRIDNLTVEEIAEQMSLCDDIDNETRDCLKNLIDYMVDMSILRKVSEGKKLHAFYPVIEGNIPNNYSFVCEIIDGLLLIEN